MTAPQSPTRRRYEPHLRAAADWLVRSERPTGGSAAHYMPLRGWSRAYPETTGYSIPTLLEVAAYFGEPRYAAKAVAFGEWLLSIQNADGSWNGGLHPAPAPKPSVFNTGQILDGMLALAVHTQEPRWIDAGVRGMRWLAAGMQDNGLWSGGDYRARETPSYYTHVHWPMLAIARHVGDDVTAAKVRCGVESVLARRLPNGAIRGWAFAEEQPAFTHTIAYTIRGIQESAILFEDAAMEASVDEALEVLLRRAELRAGRLPGAFHEDWRPESQYVCLTGNAQVARSLLIGERRQRDLRVVSAAARLVDVVCAYQRVTSGGAGRRGAVGGSQPLWGPYMRLRYPNWAAKYLCDAILSLVQRLDAEP